MTYLWKTASKPAFLWGVFIIFAGLFCWPFFPHRPDCDYFTLFLYFFTIWPVLLALIFMICLALRRNEMDKPQDQTATAQESKE
jgi:hypothetical protein